MKNKGIPCLISEPSECSAGGIVSTIFSLVLYMAVLEWVELMTTPTSVLCRSNKNETESDNYIQN